MRKLLAHLVSIAAALALLPATLLAQEGTVQGQVTDSRGAALSAASIQVDAVDQGSFTDDDGRYSLTLPAGEHRLVASALGYGRQARSVTVPAGGTVNRDFVLEVSAVELDAIVASVEAGDVTRREVGTDIASIDAAEEVQNASVGSFSDLLNARAGNVTVNPSSGNVGAGSRIRIRGINSLTQGNNPLLIIDGVRAADNTNVGINRGQTFSRFDDLDPQDIESIEVVKGPTATTLYGSEASPGVIIITTKQGRGTGANITVTGEGGFNQDVTDFPDTYADVTPFVSGADDPALSQWRTDTHPTTGQVFVLDNPFEDSDTSPFRKGHILDGHVNVQGSSDEFRYFTSAGHSDRTGPLPSNFAETTNFRANFQGRPSDVFDVNVSSGYTRSTKNLPKSGNNTSGFFLNGIIGFPTTGLGSEGDCLGTVLFGFDADSYCASNGNIRASFDKIEPIKSTERMERFTASVVANVRPLPWLLTVGKVGVDVADQTFIDAIPFDPDIPFSFAAGGENFITRNLIRNTTADISSQASYRLTESLSAKSFVGVQYFQDQTETVACEGRVFPNDQATACDAAVNLRGFSDLSEKAELGGYVQQRFNYRDYLYGTGALRVDDNSSLGELQDEIYSPSFNASFVASGLPSWNVDQVDELRLRFAWGKASQSPRQFAANRTFVISRLAQEGVVVAGLSPLDPGNPDLGAERSEEFELGFNAGLFDGRVGVDFTYFDQTTTDAILSVPVAPSTGFANNKFINVAELQNHGFEATLQGRLLDSDDMTWDARLTWSTVNPVIAEVGLENPPTNLRAGFPPGAFISREIIAAERDGDGNIIPGSVVFATGTVEEGFVGDGSNRRVMGQSTPTNTESLSTTLTLFGNLSVSTLIDRKAGHQVFAGELSFRNPLVSTAGPASSFGPEWAFRQLDLTPIEQAALEIDQTVGSADQFFINDADFIKWRELRVNYTLPSELATRLFRASRARVFFSGRNLATIHTEFRGLDPEANTRGARDELSQASGGALPPAQTFTGGISLSW